MVVRHARACALAMLVTAAAPASATSIVDSFPRPLSAFGDALGESVARSLPVPAASAGFGYVYDPTTNVFERETSLGAQLFLERAEPIGAGRWNVALVYQRIDFERYDGHALDSTSFGRWAFGGFRFSGVRLRLTVDEIVTSVTWGVTDDVEVAATLPVILTDFALHSGSLTVQDGPVLLGARRVEDEPVGPGDLLLRGKWSLPPPRIGRVALGLVLGLPTGSADDLQGSGETTVTPALYWSSGPLTTATAVAFEVHANAGMLLATDDVSDSEGRWGVGLDTIFGTRAAFGLAVLGRHAVSGLAPGPTCGDLPRSLNAPCAAREAGLGRPPVSAVGLSTGRPDFLDLSIGIRVRLVGDTLLGVAQALVPINDDGFRADVVPVVGIEATF